MDLNRKTELRRFFLGCFVYSCACYIIFTGLLIFTASIPIYLYMGVFLAVIMLFMMRIAIDERIREIGGVRCGKIGLLFPVTLLLALYICLRVAEERSAYLWAVCAVYTSGLVEKSWCALRKLKQD